MLVKSYNHLHPIVDGGNFGSIDQNFGLDICQMMSNNTKITKVVVTKELLDFRKVIWTLRKSKILSYGGKNMSQDSP
jgi:hypothetical protein